MNDKIKKVSSKYYSKEGRENFDKIFKKIVEKEYCNDTCGKCTRNRCIEENGRRPLIGH